MFILGLLAGPVIGLLGGDFLSRREAPNGLLNTIVVLLVLIFVIFVPLVQLELKCGLVLGLLLGLALSATPFCLATANESA